MKYLLPILFLLTIGAHAAPIDGFPPDPKGATVCDRLYDTVTIKEKEYNLYATVTKTGVVEIYSAKTGSKGAEWKKLYTWKVGRDLSRSVLRVAPHAETEIQFWIHEHFAYVEGRGTSVLHYTPATGKFKEHVSD